MTVKEITEPNVWNGIYNRQLDISTLPSGIYLLEIISGNERVTRKVVKMN
jgi:hypothetical protein